MRKLPEPNSIERTVLAAVWGLHRRGVDVTRDDVAKALHDVGVSSHSMGVALLSLHKLGLVEARLAMHADEASPNSGSGGHSVTLTARAVELLTDAPETIAEKPPASGAEAEGQSPTHDWLESIGDAADDLGDQRAIELTLLAWPTATTRDEVERLLAQAPRSSGDG